MLLRLVAADAPVVLPLTVKAGLGYAATASAHYP
jgi:hypothetical protein